MSAQEREWQPAETEVTLTTAQIRNFAAAGMLALGGELARATPTDRERQFDRWLAAHVVRAETPEDVREAVAGVLHGLHRKDGVRWVSVTEMADALLAEFTITRKADA